MRGCGRTVARASSALVGLALAVTLLAGCALGPFGGTTGPVATPVTVVRPGAVYILGATGTLVALTPTTGHVLWSLNTGLVSGNNAPFIDGAGQGVIYLTIKNSDPASPATGHVEAISLSTHQPLWTTHLAVQYLALQSGVVYVSDATGIAALNGVNDARYWHYGTTQPYPTAFAIANGVIYLAYQSSSGASVLDAMSAGSGALLWRRTLQGDLTSSVYVAGGRVLVVSGSSSGFGRYLAAFDAASGAPAWSQPFESAEVNLTIAGNTVYLHTSGTDMSGSVSAYNVTSGGELPFAEQQEGCFIAGPLVTSATVYVACSKLGQGSSDIEAYSVQTGKLAWKTAVPGDTVSVAALDDGMVFAQGYSESGAQTVTIALNSASGATLWRKGGSLAEAVGAMAYLTGSGVVVAINDAIGDQVWSLGGTGASATVLAV